VTESALIEATDEAAARAAAEFLAELAADDAGDGDVLRGAGAPSTFVTSEDPDGLAEEAGRHLDIAAGLDAPVARGRGGKRGSYRLRLPVRNRA